MEEADERGVAETVEAETVAASWVLLLHLQGRAGGATSRASSACAQRPVDRCNVMRDERAGEREGAGAGAPPWRCTYDIPRALRCLINPQASSCTACPYCLASSLLCLPKYVKTSKQKEPNSYTSTYSVHVHDQWRYTKSQLQTAFSLDPQ
eukprot:scaffold167741_cov34-Tisochrysis_lutea.AAC.8